MFDIAVIGLGPAGLEVADIALRNNLNIVAFEKCEIGGTCLNVGCIPTKSILYCSEFYSSLKKSSNLGVNIVGEYSFDWKKVIERKKQIVSKFNKALYQKLSKKITLINSLATIEKNDNEIFIKANEEIFQAKKIIICSGSKPVELPNLKFDNEFILNSDDMFNLEKLPESVAIIGSGAIGLEWAKILSDFNVKVSIIEKAQMLAPVMDIEIQKRLERILKANNIDFYKDDFVVDVKNNELFLNSSKSLRVEKVLSAVGRIPVLPNFVGFDNNFELKINDDFSTNIENIFVLGDANRETMLAHVASSQAKILMNKILFDKNIKKKLAPSVIYITPEIASIGLREQDISDNSKYKIKKVLIGSLAKSWCDEANDGVVKVIIENNIIVGAHIVSKEASALVSIFEILIDNKISIDEIDKMIFPHPSYCEIISEVIKND